MEQSAAWQRRVTHAKMRAHHTGGLLLIRRSAAFLLVLVFATTLAAPLVASARDGCARCGAEMKCCRAPAAGQGGCALSRACCSDSDRLTAPRGAETSTAAVASVAIRPPAQAQPVVAARHVAPSDHLTTPRDPPPRTSP